MVFNSSSTHSNITYYEIPNTEASLPTAAETPATDNAAKNTSN